MRKVFFQVCMEQDEVKNMKIIDYGCHFSLFRQRAVNFPKGEASLFTDVLLSFNKERTRGREGEGKEEERRD